jgi:hypothetical protein
MKTNVLCRFDSVLYKFDSRNPKQIYYISDNFNVSMKKAFGENWIVTGFNNLHHLKEMCIFYKDSYRDLIQYED